MGPIPNQPFGKKNNSGFFVTGTDTDVGKTLVSAWLVKNLGWAYWKPIQSGSPRDIDTLHDLITDGFKSYPSSYAFKAPLSPHQAAALEGVEIDLHQIKRPTEDPLIVEGAGGVLVPLNKTHQVIDLMAHLGLPAVVVARTTLGTINHTLLTIEALRSRGIPIHGIVFSGPLMEVTMETIRDLSGVPILAHIPPLESPHHIFDVPFPVSFLSEAFHVDHS